MHARQGHLWSGLGHRSLTAIPTAASLLTTTAKTTVLVLAGKKLRVPRFVKRALQVAVSVGLTLFVVLVIQVGDGLLSGKASVQAASASWLAFIRRPDILTVMTLTALVTVLFVYWQRDQEKKP